MPAPETLGNLYQEGAFDQEIYERIAEIVLLATKRYAHVCYLVPGHPLIYVTSSSLILDRAQRMGITTTVLPGISSLDTMIIPSADFEIVDYEFYSRLTDPAYADRLVKSKRPRRM